MLTEKEELIIWRRRYLRTLRQYRKEGRNVYYLDETWVNEGHVNDKVWVDSTVKTHKDAFLQGLSIGLRNPSGKGKRLIITHVGSERGFVSNGLMVFQSKSSGDYHEEMNGVVFGNYFKNLLPQLEDGSVIVLDNAPYHSVKVERIPNSSWAKPKILDWLESKGLTVGDNHLQKELLKLVKQEKPKYDKYFIDNLAEKEKRLCYDYRRTTASSIQLN